MGTTLARTALFLLAVAATAIAAESRDAWVLLGDEDNTMSGSIRDLTRARKVGGPPPALWLRRGGHEWVIRDAKMCARARALQSDLEKLDQKEQELSREIEELALDPVANARQIEAIAHKQEQLATRIEAKAAAMEAQLLALADEAIAAGLATSPK